MARIDPDQCALVTTYPTDSAAWLAAARIAANGGPDVRVMGEPEGVACAGVWGVYAADTATAHRAQSVLCAVTRHGQLDSRGTGWWHAAGVTRHLVCVHCGAGLHFVDLSTIPHTVLRDGALVPCNGPEVAW